MLTELLENTETPIRLAEAAVRTAQEKLDRLKAERYGLELALGRHRGRPESPASSFVVNAEVVDDERTLWQIKRRTEAALAVLREAGRPMHRREIEAMLREHGRDDSLADLSAALAYLHRSGRTVSLGSGLWAEGEVSTS